ncbi:unnamed protein product [Diamesa hyperborea]
MALTRLLSIPILILAISHIANTQNFDDHQLQPHNYIQNQLSLSRAKRMYAMCPPDFIKIGNECYYLSDKTESWLDAHFECKDRNSKLAEPLKFADKKIRKYLTNKDLNKGEKWIGGMYNWERMKWQWGYNGKAMTYQSFSNMGDKTNEELKFHCTTLNPEFSYKWSSKMCTEKHYFICQHRMPYVTEKNRQRIYNKWNETYPHQMANEVEVYVTTNGSSKNKSNTAYRAVPKKNRVNQVRLPQAPQTQKVPARMEEISPPDYLPFIEYNNMEQMKQKSQEISNVHSDLIHPVLNSPASDPRKPLQKPRKRHSGLKLTGEVNLGTDRFMREKKRHKNSQRKAQRAQGPKPNGIEETFTNPSRHHHKMQVQETTTTQAAITTTSTVTAATTTQIATTKEPESTEFISTTNTLLQNIRNDKAIRLEKLKQRLAKLTAEERLEYVAMKRQRAEAKKKRNSANQ